MTDEISLAFYTVTRVLHVGTAIALVGGTVFLRCVLMPSASAVLSNDAHDALRTRLLGVWKWFVHGGITLLLLSGFINYARAISQIRASGVKDPLYHGILGVKILLALAIFFIASVLVGRSPTFERMRSNSRTWLAVNIVLATIIVILSGFLRVRG